MRLNKKEHSINKLFKRTFALALACTFTFALVSGDGAIASKVRGGVKTCLGVDLSATEVEAANNLRHVSVHDPSIVDGKNGYYYIFGSHREFSRSKDLCNWETVTNNVNYDYNNLFKVGAAWSRYGNSNYDLAGNTWAPDVIYNKKMEKWCMYMSINGADFNSSIALLTADNIDGPYSYKGTVVYSGFDKSTHPVSKTDYYKVCGQNASIDRYLSGNRWNLNYGTNAIDPCVFYDQNGGLWMSYGSWFGGIFTLKLDDNTGLRDYNTKYALDTDASDGKASDPYLGNRIAGGNGSSGEASYIEHVGNYYYLFVTYGGFVSNGGYNTRMFRSKHLNGPYVDAAGNYATYTEGVGINNTWGTKGVRLHSYYQMASMDRPEIAGGHNSILTDSSGKVFDVYHTRFDDGEEFHEVRVHQMFMNQDGWLCEAPFEYKGETLSKTGYSLNDCVGTYEFIKHDQTQKVDDQTDGAYNVAKSTTIKLESSGKVSGAVSGSWTYQANTPYVKLYIDGVSYKGVFVKMKDENNESKMVFTAVGADNTCIWGAKGKGILDYSKTTIKEGKYYIKNANSNLYLDVDGNKAEDNTNIGQYAFNGCPAQTFYIKPVGDYVAILTGSSNYKSSLDVTGGFTKGTNISQWKYFGGDMQLFKPVKNPDGSYSFLSKVSSETNALEVYENKTTNGANVDQWEFWGGASQKWYLEAAK